MRKRATPFIACQLIACQALAAAALGQGQQQGLTIQRLLEEGWELAGYAGTFDNRSSMLLFRHRERSYLVQCSVLHDVTRAPRLITNCYELH
jgi:hypothetical protein